MKLSYFKNLTDEARKSLLDTQERQVKAEYLAGLLGAAGLWNLPTPEFHCYDVDVLVQFRWVLWATSGGCGNGCGFVMIRCNKRGRIEWSWESHEILVQYYPGTDRPLVRRSPEFVDNVPETKVVSSTVPPAFALFVANYRELMFSPEEQRKRNKPGVLVP